MDSLDTFDGSKPNLISSKMLKDIEAKLNVPDASENGNKVINGLGNFYTEYVAPNLFPLIVISLLVIYLTIKYVLKKDREEREIIEEEKERKNEKAKKHMVKVDPDELIEKGSNTREKTRGRDTKEDHRENEAKDISSMISDEYLIDDDDITDSNVDDTNNDNVLEMPESNEDMMKWVMNRETPYDIDKATALMFGGAT
ncbi:hypothetical protein YASMINEVIRUS_491 [Yasminevirus sp. GU-2018]|uniref:Uncharacterized protein n=1 Tax=Yasminevirus sp. GU-2018 TaxID=2420051 RepID=A0A5K0U7Q9_9VIRU|nr:hypothetical protein YASMINEVIRUS_491 [Yasminevirus sp. GU-2018]